MPNVEVRARSRKCCGSSACRPTSTRCRLSCPGASAAASRLPGRSRQAPPAAVRRPHVGLDPLTATSVDAELIELRDLEHSPRWWCTHQIRDAFHLATHRAVAEPGGMRIEPVPATRRNAPSSWSCMTDGSPSPAAAANCSRRPFPTCATSCSRRCRRGSRIANAVKAPSRCPLDRPGDRGRRTHGSRSAAPLRRLAPGGERCPIPAPPTPPRNREADHEERPTSGSGRSQREKLPP